MNNSVVRRKCEVCGSVIGVLGGTVSRDQSEHIADTVAKNHCGSSEWEVSKKAKKKKKKVDMSQYEELA